MTIKNISYTGNIWIGEFNGDAIEAIGMSANGKYSANELVVLRGIKRKPHRAYSPPLIVLKTSIKNLKQIK